jgi:hypothetical protein
MNIEEINRVKVSVYDIDIDDGGDNINNKRSGIKPYLRIICSCECDTNPKIRIVTFKITSAIVANGKPDLFMMMN